MNIRKYEHKKIRENEKNKIREYEDKIKDSYSLKHTDPPIKIDKFQTLNESEINEIIQMVFTSLVDTMIKSETYNLNLDQVMLMKKEFQKEGLKIV